MDAYLNEVVRYLVAQSGQIAVLTVAVAAITFTLRHRSAHVRYLLWLIVVAKCLVPPLHTVPLGVLPPTAPSRISSLWSDPASNAGDAGVANPVTFDAPLVPLESGPPSMTLLRGVRRLSASGWLGILWLTGAGAYLAMNLLRALRGHHWVRKTRRPLPDGGQIDAADLLPAYGVRRLPRIWMMEGVGQPFVWGLARGSIYVPPGFLALASPEHRRDVLAHELSHVVRLDAAVNTLQIIAQGLFWFHPFVWWAGRKVRQEREKCCDEMAIARLGTKPKRYSRAIVEALLLEQGSNGLVPSLAIAGPARNVEERIRTMLQPGKRFQKRPSLLAAACALLLALLVVPTTLALTSRPTNAAQTQASQTTTEEQGTQPQAERLLSAERLKQIGLSLDTYAGDHAGKYPEQFMAILPYISREHTDELAAFLSRDAEYLAAGKTRPENGGADVPLAYDLTLLRSDKGTNVVFADGRVEFVSGARLDEYGIRLPESHLEIRDIRFEPIHQGKNVVHVTVKNAFNQEQVFAAHIYTRSPDYGRPSPNPVESGVGWGTGGYVETLRPGETKPLRLVFKIQGPVTARTYVNLRFYNPEAQDKYEYKRYFERHQYASADLEKARADQVTREPASAVETQAVIQAFTGMQSDLRGGKYEQVWERFTKDYQKAEYQVGFEWFRRAMEPTHPMHSAFTWERGDFLKLRPGQVFKHNAALALAAALDGQTWTIDLVQEAGQWKIDWIAGYVPGILQIQEEQQRAPAAGSGNVTIQDKPPASADRPSSLDVLSVQFDPIRPGKNVVRVEIHNKSQTDQTLGADLRTEFPIHNWQRQFLEPIKGGETKSFTFAFEILGPVVDGAWVGLRFYNPPSADAFDMKNWFQERRYTTKELPLHEDARGPTGPVTQAEKDAVANVFGKFQRSLKDQDYPAAWKLGSEHFHSLFKNDLGRFREQIGSEETRKVFSSLRPESVTRLGTFLTLRASGDAEAMKLHFVPEDGQWRIYEGEADRGNWENRLLPTLANRTTEHFDIYYFKDSTAAKEIDQIARQKEEGFRQIGLFLGRDSQIRIRAIFFEDGLTKQKVTGHQGAGWAYGNTIVEVYNEKERLDPYHETTHIVMGPLGSPPALFNEGFATYMSERLGASALASLSGGKATVHQRAKELKAKGEWIELRQLLGYTEIGSAASRPPIAYPEAASFVKFLIDTYGKDKFLLAYKTLRNSNEENTRAGNIQKLEEICGEPLPTIQQRWEAALARS